MAATFRTRHQVRPLHTAIGNIISYTSCVENYLDTATKSDNEMSGWMYVKEGNEKKAVYVRMRGNQLKLSYKDTTSRTVELNKAKLQVKLRVNYE